MDLAAIFPASPASMGGLSKIPSGRNNPKPTPPPWETAGNIRDFVFHDDLYNPQLSILPPQTWHF